MQDKISFMINNISLANYEAKAKEITEILKEQFYPWFAQYMVMKRFEIALNFCMYFCTEITAMFIRIYRMVSLT